MQMRIAGLHIYSKCTPNGGFYSYIYICMILSHLGKINELTQATNWSEPKKINILGT